MLRKLIAKFILWACEDELKRFIGREVRGYNMPLAERVTTLEGQFYVLQRDAESLDASLRKVAHSQRNTKKNRNARKAMRNGV